MSIKKIAITSLLLVSMLCSSGITTFAATKDTKEVQQSKPSSITVKALMPVFTGYSETGEVINYKQYYVGQTRVDNSSNHSTSSSITFQATTSNTVTASATVSGETSAEMDAIVAKVKVTASISGTVSRSWTNGTQYGTATTVPPGKIGTITAWYNFKRFCSL